MYFRSPAEFRKWLAAHHATEKELLVGHHRKGSGTPSMTWPESVDEALCFGWIDGVRRRVDETRYTIRFTPRRTRIWSAINIALAAFEARDDKRTAIYAHENRPQALDAAAEKALRRDKTAWDFFQA